MGKQATLSPCHPVPSVVPNEHVETFLQEPTQVEGVREIYHVLVEHRIRIAQNVRVVQLVRRGWVVIFGLLRGCREKHCVDLDVPRLDPPVLTVERLRQDLAHLIWLSEETSKEEVAVRATPPVATLESAHGSD